MPLATAAMTAKHRPDRRARAPAYASAYHAPVLAAEVVDLLVHDPAGVYIDGTLGGGGHAQALLDALGPDGRVIGIDQDPDALAAAAARLAPAGETRFSAIRGNFGDLEALLAARGINRVSGVLLDLGVSSHQINEPARGFAFSAEGPLDMRMDPSRPHTAAEILNNASEAELADILRSFGEEPRAHKIARAVVERRPLATTAQLADLVRDVVPFKEEVKSLARVFQALRIAVNDEMTVLHRALVAALRVLEVGGRLAVIAYHSLEDRPVKHFFKYGNFDNRPVHDFYGNLLTPWEMVTRKPVTPGDDELEANPRSRSARLRVAEKRDPAESGLGTAYDYPALA
jgi:16S rRNA (cytosine1402-N4)-methyltransferase